MNIKNIKIDKGPTLPRRQEVADRLEQLLSDLPIRIRGSPVLTVHVGLGRIVYIRPIDSGIKRKDVKIGKGVEVEEGSDYDLVFNFKGQKYNLDYGPQHLG